MTASEALPGPKRIIIPLWLIFWGIIICILDIRINHFDIINNFVGMLMISWGVISLSRASISARYQQWMFFVVIIAIIDTIFTFFTEVLLITSVWNLDWHQNMIVSALQLAWAIVLFAGILLFLWSMKEYCSVMNWERALASWRYSTKLIICCVVIVSVVFTGITIVFLSTLEFYPKNPPPIEWSTELHYDDEGSYRGTIHIATRNGEVIYSSEIIQAGRKFNRPTLEPSQHGLTFTVGTWFAPVEGVSAGVLTFAIVLLCVLIFWALIHFLMSLYRMILAAREATRNNQ